MNSMVTFFKVLLRISVQMLLAVLIYYAFMGIQTYIFNKLPYGLSILGPMLMILAYIFMKWIWLHQQYSKRYAVRHILNTTAATIIGMCVFTGLYILSIALFIPEEFKETVAQLQVAWQKPGVHLLQVINILLAAGMEEILFRFLILSLLIHHGANRYLAILISSVLFSIVHLQYNIYVLCYIVLIGTTFSMLYLMFRNLGPAIGLHFAHNFMVDTANNFKETGPFTPNNFSELLEGSTLSIIVCFLVICLWIYTQYIQPHLQQKRILAS